MEDITLNVEFGQEEVPLHMDVSFMDMITREDFFFGEEQQDTGANSEWTFFQSAAVNKRAEEPSGDLDLLGWIDTIGEEETSFFQNGNGLKIK